MSDDEYIVDIPDEDETESLDLSQTQFEIDANDLSILCSMCKGDTSDIYKGLYKDKWKVAVKMLPGSSLVASERAKFDRQVEILKRAKHINIVKFIGSTVYDESSMMIVLELMKNCANIEQYIRVLRDDGEVMNLKLALGIGLVTSGAMEYLHSQGIMHRNLKPSNVLITHDCTLRLTGFSNAMEEIVDEEDIQPINRSQGLVLFLLPLAMWSIQKTQRKQNDRRMDIYCFGQLLYKVLKSVTKPLNKDMNATGPLYLSSCEEGFPSMEGIPESLVPFLKCCLEGRADFTLIMQSLGTYLGQIYNVEIAQVSTRTDSSTRHLGNRGFMDHRDLCCGPVISITPSATFYLAKYKSRHVVVKIFEKANIEHVNKERRDKFNRQVDVLSRIEHQNIVQFIGSCTEPSLTIVTEYMEGGTLERYLLDLVRKPLYIKIAISFALGISKAMHYLHSKGITHRDLKTSNVFLTSDQDFIKLGGFGHAREEITDEMSMTNKASSSKPTKKQNDREADVYNFSRILFDFLSNDRTTFQKYVATSKGKRPAFENVPDEMVQLLDSCASQDADERPEFKQITNILWKLQNENPEKEDEDEWVGVDTMFKTLFSHSSTENEEELLEERDDRGDDEQDEENAEKEKKKKSKRWLCCACTS
ncbi:non-receptor serine/threonine protein kinase [Lithospermum erythrorhizon]|uniref:Non-receptor serine/threonine protein kinase n=1 Tax=Lithospermum erythrorhizon TaxID=34254 RepID=A0AAV3NUD8_LITER